MSEANPLWGAPRVHGELLKLGIDVSQATVAKYMARRRCPPSQTWRTFLTNHVDQIVAADFFVVPTVTYRLLLVAVTAHPTAAWTAQQLREAFPDNTAPRYLIRDRTTPSPDWRPPRAGWGSGSSAPPLVPRGRNGIPTRFVATDAPNVRARATLQLEILALRHQLQIVERSRRQRMRLTRSD